MAHKKSGGTTAGNRDSAGKRLGVKVYGGGKVQSGQIIVRQVGSRFKTATGTKFGRDFTIFATKAGIVKFKKLRGQQLIAVV